MRYSGALVQKFFSLDRDARLSYSIRCHIDDPGFSMVYIIQCDTREFIRLSHVVRHNYAAIKQMCAICRLPDAL